MPSPLPPGAVANNLYHTTELPGVLVIAISSMIPGDTLKTQDTAQYKWFEKTLSEVCTWEHPAFLLSVGCWLQYG